MTIGLENPSEFAELARKVDSPVFITYTKEKAGILGSALRILNWLRGSDLN